MDYSELKHREIGENVFLMYYGRKFKATIIGLRIIPFPNLSFAPIKYLISIPEFGKEIWKDCESVYSSRDELDASLQFSNDTISLTDLAKLNMHYLKTGKSPREEFKLSE